MPTFPPDNQRAIRADLVTEGSAIAICMAIFNPDPELFQRQVESIRGQDCDGWTCVVVDDGSAPESLAMVREALGDDGRFELHAFGERLGFYRNFERALGLVPREARFVAFCDQDDRWYPEKLRVLRAALRPGVNLAYSDMRIVGADGTVISDTYWTRRRNNSTDLLSLLIANSVSGTACMFRRELLEFALPFPVTTPGAFHDRWIALVALALGDLAYIDRPLLDYVQHDRAAIGHGRANRGGARRRDLGGWRETLARLRDGELAQRWRSAYEDVYLRIASEAAALEERCGPAIERPKLRAVRRIATADRSPLAVPWLQLRGMRRHIGRDETLGVERGLARGIAWHQLSSARDKLYGVLRPTSGQ
jgi:glycosyltransferase involved in cell wall biosynthesis